MPSDELKIINNAACRYCGKEQPACNWACVNCGVRFVQ